MTTIQDNDKTSEVPLGGTCSAAPIGNMVAVERGGGGGRVEAKIDEDWVEGRWEDREREKERKWWEGEKRETTEREGVRGRQRGRWR